MRIYNEALKLVNLGLPIIPLCAHDHQYASPKHVSMCKCAGKTPLIRAWQTRNDTTIEHLNEWHDQFKRYNIGLTLGTASGYCGVDVDGEKGERYLQQMSGDDLPETWEFSTGQGRRLLYLIPPGTKTKKFKQADKEGGHQECALLCDGQQTVLPPSTHVTGRVYEWLDGHTPWDCDCAVAPIWLLDLITQDVRTSDGEEDEFSVVLPRNSKSPLGNISDEFEGMETLAYSDEIPIEIINGDQEVKPIKEQKQKQGSNAKGTGRPKMDESILNTPIPEGQRDNTMTQIIGHFCAKKELRFLGLSTLMGICLEYNNKWCDPPLEQESIKAKVNSFFEIETMKDAKFKEAKEDKPIFEASKLATIVDKVLLQEDGIHVAYDPESKMFYMAQSNQGPWQGSADPVHINYYIRRVIVDPKYGHCSWDKMGYVDEVRKAMAELYTMIPGRSMDFDLGKIAHNVMQYIVFNNGMYDWKEDVIVPWNPEYRTTIKFDMNFDPHVKCPNFERYMSEWLPDEHLAMVVQEYLGMCLIPESKWRTALFLYGKGCNGKSVLLEMIIRLFGEHVSSISLPDLSSRFSPARLKDKMVNICDDTDVTYIKETGRLKALISGNAISVENKGATSFDMTNTARMIFSAQERPKAMDTSHGWMSRWIFVEFGQTFKVSARVKDEMERHMRHEAAGIFNWLIDGLRRLHLQDDFTKSVVVKQASHDYELTNNNVLAFREDLLLVTGNPDDKILAKNLADLYAQWATFNGLTAIGKNTFYGRLASTGVSDAVGPYGPYNRMKYFHGIRFNRESGLWIENSLAYDPIYTDWKAEVGLKRYKPKASSE